MLKMLPRALVVAGVFMLSSSAVLAGESYVVCLGDDTKKIRYPANAKPFKCGTQGGDTARAQMFENITVIGSPLVLSTPAEVDAAESHLGIRFPTGYREYVTKFGEGVLGGSYIRIYPPHRILGGTSNNLLQWRQRISAYWFWDLGRDVLTKEEALQSVIIGDTLDGDELIVHPSKPERVFVLPRNRHKIYVAGDGLPEAIEWLCSSGTLTEAFDERNFEPFDTRRAAE
jgi:hypothetical protein